MTQIVFRIFPSLSSRKSSWRIQNIPVHAIHYHRLYGCELWISVIFSMALPSASRRNADYPRIRFSTLISVQWREGFLSPLPPRYYAFQVTLFLWASFILKRNLLIEFLTFAPSREKKWNWKHFKSCKVLVSLKLLPASWRAIGIKTNMKQPRKMQKEARRIVTIFFLIEIFFSVFRKWLTRKGTWKIVIKFGKILIKSGKKSLTVTEFYKGLEEP